MKRLFLSTLLLCLTMCMVAAPARRKPRTVLQSDGTELHVRLLGDESFHYHATLDGIPLVKEKNGDFSYATLEDNILVSTNILAHNEGNRSFEEQNIINLNKANNMQPAMRKIAKQRSLRYSVPRRTQTIRPEGEKNILVLLVEFSDEKFTFSKDTIARLFNGINYSGPENPFTEGKPSGSVRDYFVSQSDGKFTPNFVTTKIITLPNTLAHYGENNASGDDKAAAQMIVDACRAIDSETDFSIYDNDGDGTVEFVYCLYAGYSESAGGNENTIWPHQWYLSSSVGTIKLDGVKIDNYCCSSELALNESYNSEYGVLLNGIGNCCHEFSHCLGLPDLYDTSTGEYRNFGMDYWDIMDYGCYNAEGYLPIGYSAYERDFMGWRKLIELTTPGNYSMEALTAGGNAYKIVNDANENEYYILENRQQEGWDSFIFNTGMLITHIDYSSDAWYDNEVNIDADHQRVTIIPADGELLTYYNAETSKAYAENLRGDTWPGTSGRTALTDETTPAAKVFTGGYMGKPITNIAETEKTVTFSFMQSELNTPQILPATNIEETSFTANWQPTDNAIEYIVKLEKLEEQQDGESTTEEILNEDFLKCTLSNSAITSADNFFAMQGWETANVYSETGVLRIGSSSNKGTAQTPQFNNDGNVTITFKTKLYNTNDTDVTLTIYNNATEVWSKSISSTTWEEHTATFLANGDFCIIFSTEKSTVKKRVLIDDIVVTAESNIKATTVETVKTNNTTYDFANLEQGGVYRYSVQAVNEFTTSQPSQYYVVALLTTDIDITETDNDDTIVEVFSISGTRIYNGRAKYMPLLNSGIYILRTHDKVEKIIIK